MPVIVTKRPSKRFHARAARCRVPIPKKDGFHELPDELDDDEAMYTNLSGTWFPVESQQLVQYAYPAIP
jgi:hypothetical protein